MNYDEIRSKLITTFIQDRFMGANARNDLELIISSACNQKCDYCYLVKHGNKMYTPESNNPKNILHNLPILLKYLKEINYPFYDYDIFSGEFFDLPYWEEVLQIVYDDAITYPKDTKVVTIPTNMSWLMDDKLVEKVNFWYDKFESNGIGFHTSASVDGPTNLENITRPLNKKDLKEKEFYDKLFNFIKQHRTSAHPMITKQFVANYKDNYNFWIDNLQKYDVSLMETYGKVYLIPMFLYVRDTEQWDEESLKNYKEFLKYAAKKDLETYHNNDLKDFAMHIADDFSEGMKMLGHYNHRQPYFLGLPSAQNKISCSIQHGLKVRVGDLAIVPCHRLCYSNLIYGHFELNDDKTAITHISGDKVELMQKIFDFNPLRSMLKCSDCSIKAFCLKGCFGSQLEHQGEMFSPQDAVCELFKIQYKTIHEICLEYGLYDIIDQTIEIPFERRQFIRYVRKQCELL